MNLNQIVTSALILSGAVATGAVTGKEYRGMSTVVANHAVRDGKPKKAEKGFDYMTTLKNDWMVNFHDKNNNKKFDAGETIMYFTPWGTQTKYFDMTGNGPSPDDVLEWQNNGRTMSFELGDDAQLHKWATEVYDNSLSDPFHRYLI